MMEPREKKPSLFRTFARKAAGMFYFNDIPRNISFRMGLQGGFSVRALEMDLGLADRGLSPVKAAFVSDLHLGRLTHGSVAAKALEAIRHATPDVVLLGGDYLFLDETGMGDLRSFLLALEPGLGKFAVLGNHDGWLFRRRVAEALEECGVSLLVNTWARLGRPYDFVSVYGMDDVRYGNPKIDGRERSEGEKRILLCHSPEGLSLASRADFDLGLFGHTHGGQIAFRPRKPFLPFKDRYSKRFPKGFFEKGEGGNSFPVLVSSGVGCVWLPVRLFAPSEVVLIDLL